MRYHWSPPARLVLATAVAATLMSGLTVPSAGLAGTRAAVPRRAAVMAAAGQARSPAPAARPARPVFLINGDELQVGRGGEGGIAVTRLIGSSGLLAMKAADQAEAIPDDMLPYLGRGLDPALFNLTALRHAETGVRLPVRITFTGRRPSLPGITITHTSRGSELGYLTASGAARFGAALARQLRAGPQQASHGPGSLLTRGMQVTLAGPHPVAPPQSAPRPGRRLQTLTVRATSLAGAPVTGGTVLVFNADNLNAFYGHNQKTFRHGIARYDVPAGHYFALAWFDTARSVRNVILPQFTVRRSRTVRMSERAASSKISFTTARPAALRETGFWIHRISARGGSVWFVSFAPGRVSQFETPTSARPAAGALQTYTQGQLFSPPGTPARPYVYNLDLAAPAGVVPAQHWDIRQASLAAVTNRYYAAVPIRENWVTAGGFAAQISGIADFGAYWHFTVPQTQIQYFSTGRSLVWGEEYGVLTYDLCCGQAGADSTFRPGQQLTHDWNAYPLHPQPDAQLLPGPLAARVGGINIFASAFRTGNTLDLSDSPVEFSDNYPGDLGMGTGEQPAPKGRITGSYTIYQNGARIARGNPDISPVAPVRVSPKPSTIRFVLTARETSPLLPLSPASQTTWTWRSRRAPGATVPRGWICESAVSGTRTRRCAVQPLITLDYHVQALSLSGRTRPGRQVIGLDVGHVQLGGHAPITGASARVSFNYNSGRTWRQAQVTALGHGRFRIIFTAPAGALVTLQVHAADSANGSITETIVRAFGVTSRRTAG